MGAANYTHFTIFPHQLFDATKTDTDGPSLRENILIAPCSILKHAFNGTYTSIATFVYVGTELWNAKKVS
jgi:hypothetical protein